MPEPKPETEESRAAQASLEEAYQVAAKLELSVDDAMAKAGEEGIVVSARGVVVEGTDIEGCIDEIVFMPDRILVIDDKPGDMAWPGSRMQTWGTASPLRSSTVPACRSWRGFAART